MVAYLDRVRGDLRSSGRARQPRCGRCKPRDGDFVVELDDRRIEADQVVVATGPFQVPRMPAIAEGLEPEVLQIHSTAYRRAAAISPGPGPRRRRWQHRLPDRRGARGDARGPPADRLAPDAAAAADPRPRPVLVATKLGADRRRRPTRGSGRRAAATRHAHRLEPPRAAARARRAARAAGRRRLRVDGELRRRHAARRRRGHLGDRVPARPLVDRRSRCSMPTGGSATGAASPTSPGLYFLGLSWQHTRGLGAARLGQGRRRVHREQIDASRTAPTLPASAARARRHAAGADR